MSTAAVACDERPTRWVSRCRILGGRCNEKIASISVINRTPLGFQSASDFASFGNNLYEGFEAAGYKDVQAHFKVAQSLGARIIRHMTRLTSVG